MAVNRKKPQGGRMYIQDRVAELAAEELDSERKYPLCLRVEAWNWHRWEQFHCCEDVNG